jgi:serine protease Do
VLVDGKPIDEFVDNEISVRLRSPKRIQLSPDSRFRYPEDWAEGGEDRAFLGVSTEGSKEGAKIVTITENSAASKAGLKKGDIIKKINDKEVFDHEQVVDVIGDLKPDDKVTITYLRDGKENKTTATLGKRKRDMLYGLDIPGVPNPPMAPMAPLPPMQFDFDGENFHKFFNYRDSKPRLGIKAQDTEDGKGVKVIDVEDESAAEKAGIKEDDIITSFDGKEVNSAEELAKASREAKDKSSLKLQLKRNGKSQTVEIKVPKKLKTAEL